MASVYDVESERLHFIALSREAIGTAYQALPRVMVLSLVWSVLAATIVFAAPATATAFVGARSVLNRGSFGVRDAVHAFTRYFWRSQAVFVPFIVLVDLAWFLWMQAERTTTVVPSVSAFFVLDLLIVYSYLLLYYWPLLVDHDTSTLDTARSSATLALSQVRTSLGLYLFVGSLAMFLLFTVAGFVLIAPGLLATVVLLATRYLVEGKD